MQYAQLTAAVHASLAKVLQIMSECSLIRGWPRHWERMAYSSRKFIDTLAEAIDNVIGEMANCGDATIEISIGGNWTDGLNLNTAWMRIRDNATGMPLDRLEKCLSMGELANATPNSLHEHGMGMKTMLVSLCQHAASLKYIATKTINAPCGHKFAYCDHENPERPFGEIPVKYDREIFSENEHGTEFYIEGLSDKKSIYKRPQDYATHIVEQLGFKYARVLAPTTPTAPRLRIILRLCNTDGSLLDEKYEWDIKPVWPHYRNFEAPAIHQMALSGAAQGECQEAYRGYLDFGRSAHEDEYKAVNIIPNSWHPLYPFKRKIAVVMHGKVITELTITSFGGNHSSNAWVPYTGVLTLVRGFQTTHEKNGIVEDENWQAIKTSVYANVHRLITEWAKEQSADDMTNKQQERVIADAYASRLRCPLPNSDKTPIAYREYPVDGSGGRIDVFFFADENDETGFVIEMKVVEADGVDVMQTFGYMFMSPKANKKRGTLVARSFSTGAQEVARRLKQELGVEIVLRTLAEENLDCVI